MKKYIKTISLGLVFGLVLVLALVVYPNNAKAADAGEFVYFRIDTELDVLNAKGVTVEWSCNGTASGSITETAGGIASESTQLVDGTVKVASASKEMTDATCIFGTSDTIQAKVSIDGWVTRRWSVALPASTSSVFSTYASQDYNLVVGLIKDELGGALVVNGTTASASYSGTTASSSYSGGYKYIAATADGTLTGGADGYVNQTAAVTWSSAYTTSSKSADFNSSTDSTYDGTPLPFGHKVQVWQYGGTFATTPITYGVITAGDSYGTTCSPSSGYWYCPVPVANTGTSARWAGGTLQTTTTTYTDRSAGSDAQTFSIINPVSNISGGADPAPTPTPTPDATPTPIPEPGASPTPTPDASPTPTPTSTVTPTPTPTSGTVKLFRKVSDPKVYVQNSDGTLTWVRTLEEFNAAGYKWSDVKVISGSEFAKLGAKSTLGVKKGVILNVRKSASTKSVIIGKMKLNDVYEKTGQSGVWFKINFNGQEGWVHSAYTVNK